MHNIQCTCRHCIAVIFHGVPNFVIFVVKSNFKQYVDTYMHMWFQKHSEMVLPCLVSCRQLQLYRFQFSPAQEVPRSVWVEMSKEV